MAPYRHVPEQMVFWSVAELRWHAAHEMLYTQPLQVAARLLRGNVGLGVKELHVLVKRTST